MCLNDLGIIIYLFSKSLMISKKIIRAKGCIVHIFKPNIVKVVRNLSKTSMQKTHNLIENFILSYWIDRYQSLIIDTTKDKYAGRYRLGLNTLLFQVQLFFFNNVSEYLLYFK